MQCDSKSRKRDGNNVSRPKFSKHGRNNSKSNPFEVRVNRVKHNVLGRKVCKNEVGKPFESRNKAFMKRKNTLFGEYKRKDKKGKGLVDRRLNSASGSCDVLRKASVWKMKNDLNAVETTLTHKGVDLKSFNFTDTYSDLDEDDDEVDLLRRNDYVESAHFGGGDIGTPKNPNDFMNEILDEKRNKQIEKEANIELIEKLDNEWLNLKNLLRMKGPRNENNVILNDDYDRLVKQLAFSDNQEKSKLKISDNFEKDTASKIEGKNNYFKTKLCEMLSSNEVALVSSVLKIFSDYHGVSDECVSIVKSILSHMNTISLQSVSLSILCSRFTSLNQFFILKSIQFLRNIKYSSFKSVVKSAYLCHVLVNAGGDKFFPEVVQYLQNTLVLFLGNDCDKFFSPLSEINKLKNRDIFLVNTSSLREDVEVFDLSFDNVFGDNENLDNGGHRFKISFVKALFEILSSIAQRYENLASFEEIFHDLRVMIEKIPKGNRENLSAVENFLKMFKKERNALGLLREKRKPVMLPLFEPKIDVKRFSDTKSKLVKKYKREFKGAQRELKKDSAFLKDMWLKETLRKDDERKRKVKRLYAELATESSVYKKKK